MFMCILLCVYGFLNLDELLVAARNLIPEYGLIPEVVKVSFISHRACGVYYHSFT